jgi:ACS family glucarate transporter-like MFS transporter
LFGLCLAAGLAYIHRGCLSIVESTVRTDLGIDKNDMGTVMGSFFWAYALFQIPTGILSDRWGPRRALLLFGLLGALTMAMTAATLGVDSTTGFAILLVARLLMGIAQAGLFPASTRAMSVWIPIERRALCAGLLQACMSLGGAIGAYISAKLMGVVSWPWIFLIYAGPGLAWSFLWFAWYRDRPNEHPATNQAERDLLAVPPSAKGTTAPATDWFVALTSVPVILLCAQQFFRAAANVFWFTWCPTYLQETHKLDKQDAGELTSLPIIGVMVGSVAGGIVADQLYRSTKSRRISRAGTAIGATFIGVVFFCLTFFVPPNQVVLAVIALILAATIVSGGNSCAYTTAMDLGGRNLATVFGAMNMCGNFGAAIFSQIAPRWVDWFGWPALVLLVGGSYLCGMLCWLPLNPDAPLQRPPTPEQIDYEDRD